MAGRTRAVVAVARLSGDDLAAFVAASCDRSGVPVKVTDPGVVRSVTVLLTGTAAAAGGSRRRAGRSDTPDEIDPARIDAARSPLAGADGGVAEQSLHDGCLAGEVQVRPLSA